MFQFGITFITTDLTQQLIYNISNMNLYSGTNI